MELGSHLRRIGNDIVAVHLIVTDEGLTLIDAGLPGQYADLMRELEAMGRPLSDIRGIVLTHGDTDHTGFAERLRSELSIPVFVGAGDAARAQGEKPPPPTSKDRRRLGPMLRFFLFAISKGGLKIPALTEVVSVNDGDVLDLPGSPVIIGMPGHSPGSVAVYVPTVRAVFVGDELTTRDVLTGAVGPRPAPFTDDQESSSKSLDKLAELDVDWVIPGHGPAWREGAPALIAAYRSEEMSASAS